EVRLSEGDRPAGCRSREQASGLVRAQAPVAASAGCLRIKGRETASPSDQSHALELSAQIGRFLTPKFAQFRPRTSLLEPNFASTERRPACPGAQSRLNKAKNGLRSPVRRRAPAWARGSASNPPARSRRAR